MKILISALLLLTTVALRAQSVEDTVKYQLGYELYFYRDVAPKDITVINSEYYIDMSLPYAAYCYINHDKNDVSYESFSEEYLTYRYNTYISLDTTININNRNYPAIYQTTFANSKKELGDSINIDPIISDYCGYWVYLTKYEDDYYLKQSWVWILTFKISNDRIENLIMDGPEPCAIKAFTVNSNGDFDIDLNGYWKSFSFKVVDKTRKIYQDGDGLYVTPASNSKNFKLMQYCGRTEDMIFDF